MDVVDYLLFLWTPLLLWITRCTCGLPAVPVDYPLYETSLHVGSPPLVAKYVSVQVVKACGNVVVDWYALDVGQGELTFAQLYERLVAASEFRPHNFKQVLSRSATVQFFCNDEKVGRGIDVYSGLQVGQATKQFGCFIRMVIDKTAAMTEGVPRPKTAFENDETSVLRRSGWHLQVKSSCEQSDCFYGSYHLDELANGMSANGATTTYGKERILAKPRFVKQTQPIEDGPPNIKMEGNDRQQANKDNITRPTNLENTTSSANVVRTVEPQTSMFASAERLSK
ncbi:hypothetical protein Bbelb_256160 [Branchiostoma belcheri]|nr:hypothetical protein Bbelb_256160 [Branchiostoma belcheri]